MSIQDSLNHLSESYFQNLDIPIHMIYVDMELLQDFKIGALLSTCTVKEEIEYIESRMADYNQRYDLCTAKHFSVLKKTDDELLQIMQKAPIKTTLLSPWTKIYDNLNRILKYLYMNMHARDLRIKPITLVVNCADFKYPIQLFDIWATEMKRVHTALEIKFTTFPRYTAGVDFYKDFDMFFVYDQEKFFNTDKLAATLSDIKKRVFKIIFSPPFISEKRNFTENEYGQSLLATKAALNLAFDFYYMPTGIALNRDIIMRYSNDNERKV